MLGGFELGRALVQGLTVAVEVGFGVALFGNVQARAEPGDATRDARGSLV